MSKMLYKMSQKGRAATKSYSAAQTPWMKAIAESLVALFPLLPDNDWREQFASNILNSNSGQTLCWVSPNLEDLIVEYTEESWDKACS
jgi:hypothetical protein